MVHMNQKIAFSKTGGKDTQMLTDYESKFRLSIAQVVAEI